MSRCASREAVDSAAYTFDYEDGGLRARNIDFERSGPSRARVILQTQPKVRRFRNPYCDLRKVRLRKARSRDKYTGDTSDARETSTFTVDTRC